METDGDTLAAAAATMTADTGDKAAASSSKKDAALPAGTGDGGAPAAIKPTEAEAMAAEVSNPDPVETMDNPGEMADDDPDIDTSKLPFLKCLQPQREDKDEWATPMMETETTDTEHGQVNPGVEPGPVTTAIVEADLLPEDESYFRYNMQHKRRGIFIIINNRTFSIKNVEERKGSDLDAKQLKKTFSKLGFEVQCHHNQTCKNMLRIMRKAASEDHGDADCFGCAILSHGDEGIVYGTDSIMEIETLVGPVKLCRSLGGKPKLFFIQACRGTQMDSGVTVDVADGPGDVVRGQRIPLQADCLYAHSTTPGFFSWRNKTDGSWFVQGLCSILEVYGDKKELMWLLTRVNLCVAYKFESRGSERAMHKKKQIPSIMSQLTKQVYFRPKY